jgi:SAM-dependent methyltransferase
MGIGPIPAEIIRKLPLPEGFTVCELGDQFWHSGGKRRDPKFWRKPARELYEAMGCSRYESIDGNGGGTILADLNMPLTVDRWDLVRAFDLVTDVGTSEHVFNFAQVWWTIHELCKPGGLIFFEKPYQGYPDHGFYGLHKTLFVDIARANDYKILELKEHEAPRGSLWRGVYRKGANDLAPFRLPQQGKYVRKLKI